MASRSLVRIQPMPPSVDEVLAAVSGNEVGGVALFLGLVRDHDDAKEVRELSYSAHPDAIDQLEEVVAAVAAQHPGSRLAAVHRTGDLAIGDIAVVVAAGCPHRDEAFVAARQLIDDLKSLVPIWKHQLFADGSDEWVGLP